MTQEKQLNSVMIENVSKSYRMLTKGEDTLFEVLRGMNLDGKTRAKT